jgi:uncharacterized membrane protein YeaQ/YmgE (transglycosylase-associated protein family)
VLILGIILLGMVAGAVAQWLTGGAGRGVNWSLAIVAGLIGSFIGGLLASLLAGDGIKLRPSGIIGSIVGAVIVTLIYQWVVGRSPQRQPQRQPQRRSPRRR